jgi:hypothetical protein
MYESDTNDAYKYLENQQHRIYISNPNLLDPFSKAQLNSPRAIANWSELKERALRECPESADHAKCALDPVTVDLLMKTLPCLTLPTRFESPLFTATINLYIDELDKVRISHFPSSPKTLFGSLPTGTFNAQAILPRGSKDPLVILNRDIFFFTGALSKAISDAIPITEGADVVLDYSEEGIRNRLQQNPYIVSNFADAMSRLVREGSSMGAKEITLDERHNHLHARLVTAMDSFLISHEEAHVILGHVSDQSVEFHLAGSSGKRPPLTLPTPRVAKNGVTSHHSKNDIAATLRAELRTREQELEADALGFKLMIWAEEETGDPISEIVAAAAPHMVFRLLDAASEYGSEAGGWTFNDANHPPAADRIKSLAPVFDEIAKSSEPLSEADFRVPFDRALKVLLIEADPKIRQNLNLTPRDAK